MDAYDDPQLPGDVRPLSDLESVFASAERLWRAGRYDRLITVLPELLRHLYSHAQDGLPGTEHAERTHALLADTYSAVQAAAGRYGCTDLIGMAIERHLAAAAASGDPLRPAVAAFRRSQLQTRCAGVTSTPHFAHYSAPSTGSPSCRVSGPTLCGCSFGRQWSARCRVTATPLTRW